MLCLLRAALVTTFSAALSAAAGLFEQVVLDLQGVLHHAGADEFACHLPPILN